MHIEQVLGDVPKNARCACAQEKEARAGPASAAEKKSRWWQR
jgi:hypothetical protein